MPLARIDLPAPTAAGHRVAAAEVVYRALVDVAGVPEGDRFIVVNEHERESLLMDPHYFVERTAAALIVQVVFNQGRRIYGAGRTALTVP
jgi:4-oxalocrotonate tautomerase